MSQPRAKTEPRTNQIRRRTAFLRNRLSDHHDDSSVARIRDLLTALLDRLGEGPHDLATEADALEAAELTVLAEQAREDLKAVRVADLKDKGALKDKANLVNAITRLSSTAARAKRAFLKTAPAKPRLTLLQQKLKAEGRL
jgi:hypothetical protein